MRLTLSLIVTILLTVTAMGQAEQYVGFKYKPVILGHRLPNGLEDMGGAIVSDLKVKPTWGISIKRKGTTRMLWLEKATAEDGRGVNEWEVADVLVFPRFTNSQDLLFGGGPGDCTYSGKTDDHIVVHAQFFSRSLTYKTINAWRADTSTGKFVPLNASLAKCKYDAP